MKKTTLALMLFLGAQFMSFGQSKNVHHEGLKEKIIALEKEAWRAWQNKDPKWYTENATEECLWVTPAGVSNKTDWVKTGASACDVKTYSLANFQLVSLSDNAVVITYTATVEAICGNYQLPNKMRASVTYVKRKGKWLEAFYMEMPLAD